MEIFTRRESEAREILQKGVHRGLDDSTLMKIRTETHEELHKTIRADLVQMPNNEYYRRLSDMYAEVFARRVSQAREDTQNYYSILLGLDDSTLQRIRIETHEELHKTIRAELEKDNPTSAVSPILASIVCAGLGGYVATQVTGKYSF